MYSCWPMAMQNLISTSYKCIWKLDIQMWETSHKYNCTSIHIQWVRQYIAIFLHIDSASFFLNGFVKPYYIGSVLIMQNDVSLVSCISSHLNVYIYSSVVEYNVSKLQIWFEFHFWTPLFICSSQSIWISKTCWSVSF